MNIRCHICGMIPEDDSLLGWESKTITGRSGYTFTEWYCPICSGDPR